MRRGLRAAPRPLTETPAVSGGHSRLSQPTAEISSIRMLRLNCRRIAKPGRAPWLIGNLKRLCFLIALGDSSALPSGVGLQVPGFSEARGPW
jgi:hypothetical protein